MPAYFSPHPPFRLLVALALSLILHGGLLIQGVFKRPAPQLPPPPLEVRLRVQEPAPPTEPAPTILKNTFSPEGEETPETPPPAPAPEATPPAPPPAPVPQRPQPERKKPAPERKPPPARPIERPAPKPLPREYIKPAEPIAPPPPLPPAPPPQAASGARPVAAVQRKLSEFVFYPEEARVQGIEGTVYLFIQLDANCAVEDVRIDGSSGSRLLDKAAEKGAWAIQQLPGCRSGVYPYIFRLVD